KCRPQKVRVTPSGVNRVATNSLKATSSSRLKAQLSHRRVKKLQHFPESRRPRRFLMPCIRYLEIGQVLVVPPPVREQDLFQRSYLMLGLRPFAFADIQPDPKRQTLRDLR